jgi:hypothetical protein
MHPLLVQTGNMGLGDHTGGRDHGSRHTVTDKQDDILGLALLGSRIDIPDQLRGLLGAGGLVLVFEEDLVGSRLAKLDVAPGGRGDVDGCGGVLVAGLALPVGGCVLEVRKVPGLGGVRLDLCELCEVDRLGRRLVAVVLAVLGISLGELADG